VVGDQHHQRVAQEIGILLSLEVLVVVERRLEAFLGRPGPSQPHQLGGDLGGVLQMPLVEDREARDRPQSLGLQRARLGRKSGARRRRWPQE
jgi:hypothetical protein